MFMFLAYAARYKRISPSSSLVPSHNPPFLPLLGSRYLPTRVLSLAHDSWGLLLPPLSQSHVHSHKMFMFLAYAARYKRISPSSSLVPSHNPPFLPLLGSRYLPTRVLSLAHDSWGLLLPPLSQSHVHSHKMFMFLAYAARYKRISPSSSLVPSHNPPFLPLLGSRYLPTRVLSLAHDSWGLLLPPLSQSHVHSHKMFMFLAYAARYKRISPSSSLVPSHNPPFLPLLGSRYLPTRVLSLAHDSWGLLLPPLSQSHVHSYKMFMFLAYAARYKRISPSSSLVPSHNPPFLPLLGSRYLPTRVLSLAHDSWGLLLPPLSQSHVHSHKMFMFLAYAARYKRISPSSSLVPSHNPPFLPLLGSRYLPTRVLSLAHDSWGLLLPPLSQSHVHSYKMFMFLAYAARYKRISPSSSLVPSHNPPFLPLLGSRYLPTRVLSSAHDSWGLLLPPLSQSHVHSHKMFMFLAYAARYKRISPSSSLVPSHNPPFLPLLGSRYLPTRVLSLAHDSWGLLLPPLSQSHVHSHKMFMFLAYAARYKRISPSSSLVPSHNPPFLPLLGSRYLPTRVLSLAHDSWGLLLPPLSQSHVHSHKMFRFFAYAARYKRIAPSSSLVPSLSSHNPPFLPLLGSRYLPTRVLSLAHDSWGLPKNFDWRDRIVMTPVRDQQECLSCSVFAVVASIEALIGIKKHKLVQLSVQYPLSHLSIQKANHKIIRSPNHSFPGTRIKHVFETIKRMGIPLEESFPYRGRYEELPKEGSFFKFKIDAYKGVLSPKDIVRKMMFMVLEQPIVVAVDSKKWKRWNRDMVYSGPPSQDDNHTVLLTGFGVDEGTQTPFWWVKNSWGTEFGINGYVRIALGINAFGIENQFWYPIIR